MYYIPKVKSWIKRSAKKTFLLYYPEAELISDNRAIIHVQPNMKQTSLEVFGHLDGGVIRAGVYTGSMPPSYAAVIQNFMELRDEENRIQLMDSKLKAVCGKDEFRILYVQETGNKILINEMHVAMIKGFDVSHLYSCADRFSGDLIHVVFEEKVVGLITPAVPADETYRQIVDSFDFKV